LPVNPDKNYTVIIAAQQSRGRLNRHFVGLIVRTVFYIIFHFSAFKDV